MAFAELPRRVVAVEVERGRRHPDLERARVVAAFTSKNLFVDAAGGPRGGRCGGGRNRGRSGNLCIYVSRLREAAAD